MLSIFPGDTLRGLYCSHLQILFVFWCVFLSVLLSPSKTHVQLDSGWVTDSTSQEHSTFWPRKSH
uniref:Uncharacterized protein n=1 Tax=Anguilla anguilla TaxID=7936 RepID=A0A0E9QNX0_ANGAN